MTNTAITTTPKEDQVKPRLVAVAKKSSLSQQSVDDAKPEVATLASRPTQNEANSHSSNLNFHNSRGVSCPPTLNNDVINGLEGVLRASIREFTLQHGISLTELGLSLSEDSKEVVFTVKASALNFYGMDKTAMFYLDNCHQYGFKPSWLGLKFNALGNVDFIITGMDKNSAGAIRVRVYNGKMTYFVKEQFFAQIIQAFD